MTRRPPCLSILLLAAATLTLVACEPTEKERLGDLAVQFLEYDDGGQYGQAYEMASAEDQEAADREEDAHLLLQFIMAYGDETSREVESVTVDKENGTASVFIVETRPAPWESDDAAKTDRRTVDFVREGGAWKVDADWAEKKEAKAEHQRQRAQKKKVDALVQTASELRYGWQLREAKAALAQALEMDPDNKRAQQVLESVERRMKTIVAGKWRMPNPAREDRVVLYLNSTNTNDDLDGSPRHGSLAVRCRNGAFSTAFRFVTARMPLDTEEGYIPAQLTLDDQAPRELPLRLTSDGRDPVDVLEPRPFIDALRQADRLTIEAPTMLSKTIRWTYDLEGAPKALAPVYERCGKSEKNGQAAK